MRSLRVLLLVPLCCLSLKGGVDGGEGEILRGREGRREGEEQRVEGTSLPTGKT